MFVDFNNILDCDVCGAKMSFDMESTGDDYAAVMSAELKTLSENVQSVMLKHLAYKCQVCGTTERYTFKELESRVRRNVTKQLLQKVVMDLTNNTKAVSEKYLIYCGKCTGFDAKGSCPQSVYDKCEIKRFPINEL